MIFLVYHSHNQYTQITIWGVRQLLTNAMSDSHAISRIDWGCSRTAFRFSRSSERSDVVVEHSWGGVPNQDKTVVRCMVLYGCLTKIYLWYELWNNLAVYCFFLEKFRIQKVKRLKVFKKTKIWKRSQTRRMIVNRKSQSLLVEFLRH